MQFSREQLDRFVNWEPVEEGYSRDGSITENRMVAQVIQPLIDKLRGAGLYCDVGEHGGLSNYYSFFVSETSLAASFGHADHAPRSGVIVYLSMLGPYAAIGRPYRTDTECPSLDPKNVLDPNGSSWSVVESSVLAALRESPYQILGPTELGVKLPDGVRPFEYCLCAEPWDTVFHVMFTNTD